VTGRDGGPPPAIRDARHDVPERRVSALSAASRLLASTAEAIGPDTPASELLACLTRYRAHLSALVTASRPVPSPIPATACAGDQSGAPPRVSTTVDEDNPPRPEHRRAP
jgi:hypothetical protein